MPKTKRQTLEINISHSVELTKVPNKKGLPKKHQETVFITHI